MKRILLIVVGVVLCACLISIQPWAGSGATSKQVIHGDINVIGTLFEIENKHYQMDGNITVKDNGTLILKNVILEFLQDEYKKYHFSVDNGSKVIMENTYLFVTANATRPYLKFTMTINDHSECFINNSTIAFPGWLNVADSDLALFNSIIKKVDLIPSGMSVDDNDDCPLLFFNTGNIVMVNSRIENYYEDSGLPAALDMHSQIQNLIASDGSVVEVKYGETLTVNQFNSSELLRLPTNRLTAAMLEVTYATERYYNGTNFIEWSQDGSNYLNTSIKPENQNKTTTEDYTEKYDLWLQGIRTVEEACNVCIRFINNDIENDLDSNVSFDRIRLVVSYDKNIVLIDSSLYAFNTYLDIDFKPADADPTSDGTQATTPTTYLEDSSYDHNTLRALENSELYLYNVTVKDIYQPNSDPPFLTDISSEAFIYRLLTVNVLDSIQMPLSNAIVNIFYYEDKTPVEYPSDLVLACIGRTSQNYNQTDIYGNVIFPLLSDIISTKDWPNAEFVGKYSINISYKEYRSSKNVNLTQYPLISAQDNSPVMACVFTELIPDLTPAIYLSTSTPTDGDTVEIIATIYNSGTTNAYGIPVTFYDNDQEVDENIIPVVNYNESVQISANWTANSITPSELHNISVCIDKLDTIPESNENNNLVWQNVIVFSRPDLYVMSIGFSDYYPIENDTITIFCIVGNSGETSANCDIEFYANNKLIATENILVPANSTSSTSGIFNTAGECGNVNITLKITNCAPAEENFVDNEMNSTLRIYSARSGDLVLDKTNRAIERNYEARNIIVRNCDFIISNATLTIPQDAPEQYRIIVLQNARIIFYNSTVKSDYQLYLYVYNSTLSSTNSTLSLSIICSGSADITFSGTVLNGMINAVCNNFTAKNTVFNSSSVIINATSINIENSNITNISAFNIISMQAQEIQARNTTLSAAAIFENGPAHLINVTVPSVTVKNATVYKYWWLKVAVEDKAGSKLQNVTVRIFSWDKEEYLSEIYKTDSEGIATLQLLAEEITPNGTIYTTNYRVDVTYENETVFENFIFKNNTEIKKTYSSIIISPTELELTLELSSESVDAGSELTVSGTVNYNVGSKPGVANINVTITVGGTLYTAVTDATGSYSCNITAPKTGGTYTIVASVVEQEFNVQGTDQKTLFVQAPPAKPVDIVPIIIAIIIIVVVLIVCVIKRKLLKAYLIVLKAKLKKEEFTECTECSKNIPSLLKKCPYCDTELGEEKEKAEEERAKCSECGALIPASAKKCPKCGATFEE